MKLLGFMRRILPAIAMIGLLGGSASCIVVADKKSSRHGVHKAGKHRHDHCHRRGKKGKKRVCHSHPHTHPHH